MSATPSGCCSSASGRRSPPAVACGNWAFAAWDAETKFGLDDRPVPDHKSCECAAILCGAKGPTDCKLFGTVCTPETPMGACMVSSEGACAAHYNYGRFRDHAATP